MSEIRRVVVSDHALLRYLERSLGVDVEAARATIIGLCQRGADCGGQTVLHGGLRYVLKHEGGSTIVVTTLRKRIDYVHRSMGGGHGS